MKHDYPRIIQIMPADNIWIRFIVEGEFYYNRASCLILYEDFDSHSCSLYTKLQYVELEITAFDEIKDSSQDGFLYSTKDLTNETKLIT